MAATKVQSKTNLLFVLGVVIVLIVSGVESQSVQRGVKSGSSYDAADIERRLGGGMGGGMGGMGGMGMQMAPPAPTASPSVSLAPSRTPSGAPSGAPSISLAPSRTPSGAPSGAPSISLAPSTSQAPSSTMMSFKNNILAMGMGSMGKRRALSSNSVKR